MAENYSSQLADAVISWLEQAELKYHFNPDSGRIDLSINIRVKNARSLRYVIDINETFYIVSTTFALSGDTDDMEAMRRVSEYVNRANYGLRIGCFTFDFNDGELGYQVTVDCGDQTPAESVIEHSVVIPASMFERYGDGLIETLMFEADPKEEIDKAEGK